MIQSQIKRLLIERQEIQKKLNEQQNEEDIKNDTIQNPSPTMVIPTSPQFLTQKQVFFGINVRKCIEEQLMK